MQKYNKIMDFQAEKGRKHKIIAKNLEVIEKLLIYTAETSGCLSLNMVQIRTMIEVVAQYQILQVLIAIQLLIIIIGNGKEFGLILSPEHRYSIATKITARHGYNMPC